MYTEFYKLTAKPFQLSPNPKFFFGSAGHQKAMAYLQYGLHQAEGFVVITGDIGTGKTTLLGHLLDQLDSNQYLAAKLVTTQLDPDDMLRMVVSSFGIESRGRDKATMLGQFERFLLDNQQRGRRTLVLVDEVQNLPIRSLEELRMLSNFQANEIAPIQFCLLGQPQFQHILASDELVQLRQRVIVSYHLGPLSSHETRTYIEHRLRLVDWKNDPKITDEAYSRIHHYAAGVPRRINLLCDRLLLCGMLEDLHEIGCETVDAVAGEMSQEGTPAKPRNAVSKIDPVELPAADTEGANAALDDLERRLASAERVLQVHDKALRRAVQLAEYYVKGRSALLGTDLKEPVHGKES
ncbi:MAG TPA: XrtA/PEP-CTERM system-associated ATPase [Stellaceae bacterium]|nr:XrtA/PEP-CTERM system-associated ATPase [Stellaceae bacterium]